MSAVAFDVAAVRARFSALDRRLVFFDGPGGSQVPDEVIEAIATYLRESNANVSGPYETSRRTEELVDESRRAGAGFLGCTPEEVVFGANMTTLNFTLSRTVGRTLREGDEILVTRLDHDGNVSPWLELAHDVGARVGFVDNSKQNADLFIGRLSELLRDEYGISPDVKVRKFAPKDELSGHELKELVKCAAVVQCYGD